MIVLIVGLGSIARKHIKAIKTINNDTQIWALRSDKKTVEAHDVDGVISIFNLDELLEKPDFIIISNLTSLHYQTLENCLKVGCPIIIEKPVLENTEGYQKLLSEIEQKSIITYVACNLRFHPCITFLHTHIQSSKFSINEVNVYCGSYLPDWRPNRDFREIYSANKEMGGGVHLDLIHEIDYCVWLFGTPISFNSTKANKSSLNISAYDYAHYALEYPSFYANVTLNYYRKDARRQIEILFEHETLTIDLLKGTIVSSNDGIIFNTDFDMKDTYIQQIEYFLDCINKSVTPMNNFEEAIQTLKICNF
jgi:predicted dehydrogenase